MHTTIYSLIRPFLLFTISIIVFLTLTRTGLALWQVDRFEGVGNFANLIGGGFRIDMSSAAYLCAVPALLHPWISRTRFHFKWSYLLKTWFFVCFIAILFFELATPAFIN